MQAMLPKLSGSRGRLPEVLPAVGPKRARVALFLGCVADAMFPDTNAATARVLQENGCEVVIPRGQSCCGAIHYHSGVEGPALELARRNLETFKAAGVDAIIVNAAGCGAMLKDYAHILPAELHDEAAQFVSKVKDISEFLMALGPIPPRGSVPLKVTYHDACHLCHGQQIRSQPRALLAMIPGLRARPPGRDRDLLRRGRDLQPGPARDVRAAGPAQDGPYRGHGCRRLSPPETWAASFRSPARSRNAARTSMSSIRSICSTGPIGGNKPARFCVGGCTPLGPPNTNATRLDWTSLNDCETMRRVVILGAGGMGTALALLFGKAGADVRLWSRDPEHAAEFARTRVNVRHLPGIKVPETVTDHGRRGRGRRRRRLDRGRGADVILASHARRAWPRSFPAGSRS